MADFDHVNDVVVAEDEMKPGPSKRAKTEGYQTESATG